MTIALATTADGHAVARFGHDNLLLAVAPDGTRTRRSAEGCCGALARTVSDCEAVICSGIGRGAAGHLDQAGVKLVMVPEGTPVAAALLHYRNGKLAPGGEPTACDHGHEHGEGHGHGHGHHEHGGKGCGCHG